jgi:hypothetical protein
MAELLNRIQSAKYISHAEFDQLNMASTKMTAKESAQWAAILRDIAYGVIVKGRIR